MKAVIMAGGFGTRLRPLTNNIPKPMVSVANKPMMEHIIDLLRKHGLTEIIALLYFQAEEIKNYFGDGSKFGVKIEYILQPEDYGTAGSVKNAEKLLDQPFLVISGDVLTDLDLKKAIEFHSQNKALATMVLTRMDNPLSYGIVITESDGRIERFLEKPTWGEVFSDTVNTGIYILEVDALKRIPPKQNFDFSKDLFPLMLKNKDKLYGYIAQGYWRDVGNLEEYFQAHQDILNGKVKIELEGNKLDRQGAVVFAGKNAHIEKEVSFKGTTILGDNCSIKAGVLIEDSVIGRDTEIGKGTNISRSIVWERVKIGSENVINEAIIANNVKIGKEALLSENSIISSDCVIGDGAKIKANVKIWPDKEVEAGSIVSSSLVWGEKWNRELFTDAKVVGIGNFELTPEFAVKLGATYGAFLGKGSSVIVSRDAARSSRMTNRAIVCGLLSVGVNVQDLRTLPIPVVRYGLKVGRENGGIHVRVSPSNDKEMNIIFFDGNGQDLPTSKAKAVERLFFREDFRRASMPETGRVDFPQRVVESYREDFLRAIDAGAIRDARFKIVIDYSHGGASEIFPSIFGTIGCDVISLNAYLDPKKLSPTPKEEKQSLKQLSSIVRSIKVDVGFLLDVGAEKIKVVDERGEVIDDNLLLLIVISLLLNSQKIKRIAVPVVASMRVEEIAREYGVEVIRVRNDHLAMMDALSSHKVDFVGGTRGGFIFSGFQLGADAMFDVIKILELMAKSTKRISQLKNESKKYFLLSQTVPCPWDSKGKVMRKLMEFSQGKERQLIDGVRVIMDNAWVLIVPDRQTASFDIFVEAKTKFQAEKLLKESARKVKKWQK
jgi:mannose-1-phosphate guanylyltransferase/phosphomannomutase